MCIWRCSTQFNRLWSWKFVECNSLKVFKSLVQRNCIQNSSNRNTAWLDFKSSVNQKCQNHPHVLHLKDRYRPSNPQMESDHSSSLIFFKAPSHAVMSSCNVVPSLLVMALLERSFFRHKWHKSIYIYIYINPYMHIYIHQSIYIYIYLLYPYQSFLWISGAQVQNHAWFGPRRSYWNGSDSEGHSDFVWLPPGA